MTWGDPDDIRFWCLVALVVAVATTLLVGVTGRSSWPAAAVMGASGGLAGVAAAAWLNSGRLLDPNEMRRRFAEGPGVVVGLFTLSALLLVASRAADGAAAGALVVAGCVTGLVPFLRRR